MNQNIKKWVALIVVAIIALSGIYFFFIKGENTGAAGDINTTVVKFVAGLKAGKVNSSGVFPFSVGTDGSVTSSGSLTNTGTTTVEEFTQGGGIATLTDANGGTYTLTQAELLTNHVLKFAAGGAGQAVIALTLPATSTLNQLLPTAGQSRTWIYDASDLAAATTTTWTAGTGIDLIAYTTNDDVIDGAEFSQLTCWRQADTDVSCIVSELVHSD